MRKMGKFILSVLPLLGGWVACTVWIPDFFQHKFTLYFVSSQIIVGSFVFGILCWRNDWHIHTNTGASILTMIGVFGTFLGIFIGLQGFGKNIDTDISGLLEGLKLAFLTSIVGIGSAIVLKGIVAPLFRRKSENPSEVERDKFINDFRDMFINNFRDMETSGEKNLHAELVRLNTTLEILKDMKTEITGIKEALTGGDESTVFAQLQKLTSTVSEKVGEMAEKVGEIATGQLIEALKGVIRDFNKNLTEQFGDNFKQLNEAVGRTVEWQEQYRQQMDELSEEFRIAAQSVEQSETALADAAQSLMTIGNKSERLISIAEKLDPILHTLNNQLEAFSELRQQAHDAFPLIESRLNDLTIGFSDTVKTAINDSYSSMEAQRNALTTQTDALQRSSNETTQQITDLTTHFSDVIKTSIDESQASINQQQEVLTTQSQQLQTAMRASDRQIQQTIDEIGDRLDGVFERSASHITQVTEGFTQNLTQQLTDLTTHFSDAIQTSVAESQDSVNRQQEVLTNQLQQLQTAMRASDRQIQQTINDIGNRLDRAFERSASHIDKVTADFTQNLTQQLTDILQGQAQEFGTIVERNRADIKNHVDNLHTALERELTTSLQTLAGYLAELSKGFVDNYTQLVGPYNQVLKDLKQLVEASQDLQQPVDTSHQVQGKTEGVQ